MNYDLTKLENMTAIKTVLGNNYDEFMETISINQEEISKISSHPVDNYRNHIMIGEDRDLLSYLYKNVRYYLNAKQIYTPKIEEGMAIVVSKAIILASHSQSHVRNYFSRGNYAMDRAIANPFEEISRMILNSILCDSYSLLDKERSLWSFEKVNQEDKSILEVLQLATTKDGVSTKISHFGRLKEDYTNLCTDLELSMLDSNHVATATTLENREVILTQLDRIMNIYQTKLEYEQMITTIPTIETSTRLKTKFEDKIIFAKRNIGVYEKTKRLVKNSAC